MSVVKLKWTFTLICIGDFFGVLGAGHSHHVLCPVITCTPTFYTGGNRSNHQWARHCFASPNNGVWVGTSMQGYLLWRSPGANVGKERWWEQGEGMQPLVKGTFLVCWKLLVCFQMTFLLLLFQRDVWFSCLQNWTLIINTSSDP
jgi:hypothetical protein